VHAFTTARAAPSAGGCRGIQKTWTTTCSAADAGDSPESDKLHYDWHWSWATGNGEFGNNGVHLLDVALRSCRRTPSAPRARPRWPYVHHDAADRPLADAVYDYPLAP